jgi:hypothetical protein
MAWEAAEASGRRRRWPAAERVERGGGGAGAIARESGRIGGDGGGDGAGWGSGEKPSRKSVVVSMLGCLDAKSWTAARKAGKESEAGSGDGKRRAAVAGGMGSRRWRRGDMRRMSRAAAEAGSDRCLATNASTAAGAGAWKSGPRAGSRSH